MLALTVIPHSMIPATQFSNSNFIPSLNSSIHLRGNGLPRWRSWWRVCLPMQETQFQSLGRENTLEEGMATHCSILAWESHGQRSLAGHTPWGCKESGMTKWLTHTQLPSLLKKKKKYILEKHKHTNMSTYIQKCCINPEQPKVYKICILFIISGVSFL